MTNHSKVEGWREEFDRNYEPVDADDAYKNYWKFGAPSPMSLINFISSVEARAEERGRQQNRDAFTNKWIEEARLAERSRLKKLIEGAEVQKDYDGNNLHSAGGAYGIGADSWDEIVRYEQGRDSFKSDLLSKLQDNET